ncbi:MAG: hypothetical protein U1E73_01820 [Planctomycetota bacterium]
MTTQQEVESVKARLAEEQTALRTRVAQANERLQRIAFAAESGDGAAVRERSALLADRLTAKNRLEEIATALASADLLARDAEDAATRARREAALGEVRRLHDARLGIAAKLDDAFASLNVAWLEFTESNADLNPLLVSAGLPPGAGRHDAGWLMRAFWHLSPDVARQIRLAPQLRSFGQPFVASLAQRAPGSALNPTSEQLEQETSP